MNAGEETTYRDAARVALEAAENVEANAAQIGTRNEDDRRLVDRMSRIASECRSTALVMATLELATQQRIANLITLEVIGGGPLSQYSGDMAGQYLEEHYPAVAEALGVAETLGRPS